MILVSVCVLGAICAVVTHCVFDLREVLTTTRSQLNRLREKSFQKTEPIIHAPLLSALEARANTAASSIATPYSGGELAVVACHFNPLGWHTTRENYLRFLREMRRFNIPLFTAEVAFNDQTFASPNPFLAIKATNEHMLWQKERLLNYLVENLPSYFGAIAFIDADILFLNPSWGVQALDMLGNTPVVQLFDRMHRLDPEGCIASTFSGALQRRGARGRKKGELSPWIGGAWAAQRNVFPLYDRCVLGGGDVANYEGWLGLRDTWLQRQMSPAEFRFYDDWARQAQRRTSGIVGGLGGECIHMYHGQKQHRAYASRHAITRMWSFDPMTHLALDENGLLRWTEDCPPGLRSSVGRYFAARREDG